MIALPARLTPVHRSVGWLGFGLAAAAAAALFAAWRGQDVNFDQLNYHYYAAYALLHGRIDLDAAPAQIIHSYLEPLGYVPFYLLLRLAGPVAAATVLAAAQSLNVVLVAALVGRLLPPLRGWTRRMAVAAGVVLSAASPMALSELGTSFIDTLTSLPILAALLLLPDPDANRQTFGRLLASGALVGFATALKLTNATFAVGLLAACVLDGPGLGARIGRAARLVGGAAAAFLVVAGPRCWALWVRFSSPLFPYYNNIFRSPDFRPAADIDHRYLPAGLLDGLATPFRWAVGIKPEPEIGFTDIRFGLVLGLLALGLVLRRGTGPERHQPSRAGARLVAFWTVSLAVWLAVFAIQRYIVVLELLCGPVALVALTRLVRGWRIAAGLGASAAAALATVVVPNWQHVPFLPGQYGLAVPPALADDGVFFVAGEPMSYVLPVLSPRARFFGIMEWDDTLASADTTITRRIAAGVRDAGARRLRVLANAPLSVQTRLRLGSYGVQPTGACTDIPGYSYRTGLLACDLARGLETGMAALTLRPGVTLDFADPATAFLARLAGDWRGPVAPGSPALLLRRSPEFGGGAIHLDLRTEPAATASIGGVDLVDGCLPEAAIGPDGTIALALHASGPVRLISLTATAACHP